MEEDNHASIIRNMINHENELTNHRIQWLLIIQGFLTASIGVALNLTVNDKLIFISLVVICGMLSCLSACNSLQAANIAKRKLEQDFNKRYPHYDGPPVIGLQVEQWPYRFLRPDNFLPALFFIFWLLILGFATIYK